MMTSNFDTLKATKNLTGKTLFNKKQAEKLVGTVADAQSELVTKTHLSNEIKLSEARLETRIEALRNDLYKALFIVTGIIIAAIGILG